MIEGHIYTEGRITKEYPDLLKKQIFALAPNITHVVHHIQSPGGDCYASYAGYHELMKIGKPIKSIIEGEAQSMATFLAIAPAYQVEILDPSTFMIHEPFFPEGVAGTVDELQAAQTELEQIRNAMAEAYAKKTGKTKELMLAMMKKTTRMDANMAKREGFVDIVTEPKRMPAMAELIEEIKQIKNEIMSIFKRTAVAAAPLAMDFPLKDGKALHVESETEDLVGKPGTVDGVPADGVYELADGRKITCVAGVVTAVEAAMTAPAQTPQQALESKLAQVQAELATIKAAELAKVKAAEDAAKIAAEQAKQAEIAKALEEKDKAIVAQAKEIEELKKKEVGNTDKPFEGMTPNRTPVGFETKPDKLNVMATRTMLADNLPWLEKHYKGGRYSDGTDFSSYRSAGGPNAVSILETNLNYTWNGVLSTDLFFCPTIGSPALADIFTIDLGAADKKRYHIAPNMNKVLKPYTGCGQAVTGSSFDITSKYIQLKPFEMFEKWCKDDFTDQLTGSYNVLAQEWLKTGTESFDPAGTPVDRMIMKLLKDALRRDIFRRVSFGDTTSASADWNQIDGYWQSLIDNSGASNYCVYRSGAALGIGTLAAGTALAYFEAIYNGSSDVLKDYAISSGRGRFLVTRSVWENYYTSLAANGAVTEQAFTNLVKGIDNLTFRGIPVIPIGLWDDQLKDATNPLSATVRHLISFTVKDNSILGVENTADLDKIDSWFEKKDNVRYYRSNMIMGFLPAICCDLTTISY